MKPPCTTCDRIHDPSDVRAIGRFNPDGPIAYLAMTPDAPFRSTRAEARRDVCAGWIDIGEAPCRGCGNTNQGTDDHVYGERKCCPDCDHRPLKHVPTKEIR